MSVILSAQDTSPNLEDTTDNGDDLTVRRIERDLHTLQVERGEGGLGMNGGFRILSCKDIDSYTQRKYVVGSYQALLLNCPVVFYVVQ